MLLDRTCCGKARRHSYTKSGESILFLPSQVFAVTFKWYNISVPQLPSPASIFISSHVPRMLSCCGDRHEAGLGAIRDRWEGPPGSILAGGAGRTVCSLAPLLPVARLQGPCPHGGGEPSHPPCIWVGDAKMPTQQGKLLLSKYAV